LITNIRARIKTYVEARRIILYTPFIISEDTPPVFSEPYQNDINVISDENIKRPLTNDILKFQAIMIKDFLIRNFCQSVEI
jgi:hypothetical protein